MMRLALDGTPLLGPRSGIGEVVSGIIAELARRPDLEVVAYGAHAARPQGPRGRGAARRARGQPYVPGASRAAVVVAHGVPAGRALDGPHRRRARDELRRAAHEGGRGGVGVRPRVRALPGVRGRRLARLPGAACGARSGAARGSTPRATSCATRSIETFAVPPERVVRVYPGIPPIEGGDAARGRALAGTDRYVLALGTIEPRKNYPALVRAFDALAADDPDLVLVVAGIRGWGGDAFDAAVASAHHRDRVLTPRLRVGRRPPRPARRRLGAGVPVALRRASASRRSRRWRPASRWSPPTPGRSPRSWATPPCSSSPTTSTPSPAPSPPRSPTTRCAACSTERGRERHRAFTWTETVDQLLDLYEAVRA